MDGSRRGWCRKSDEAGFQPVNITAQFYGNAKYPVGGSPWSMRLQIAFLFPKLSKEQEKMIAEKRLKQLEQEQAQQPKT